MDMETREKVLMVALVLLILAAVYSAMNCGALFTFDGIR
jgi:hypothetical protein